MLQNPVIQTHVRMGVHAMEVLAHALFIVMENTVKIARVRDINF